MLLMGSDLEMFEQDNLSRLINSGGGLQHPLPPSEDRPAFVSDNWNISISHEKGHRIMDGQAKEPLITETRESLGGWTGAIRCASSYFERDATHL